MAAMQMENERGRDGEKSRAKRGSGSGDLEWTERAKGTHSSHNMPGRIYGLAGGLGVFLVPLSFFSLCAAASKFFIIIWRRLALPR